MRFRNPALCSGIAFSVRLHRVSPMKALFKAAAGWFVPGVLVLVVALSFVFALFDPYLTPIWPSMAALLVVFTTRSALLGLFIGALCGAVLVADGRPDTALLNLLMEQFLPIFDSTWKISAILFTLILGGFVALIESGGGLQALIRRFLGSGRVPARRMQLGVIGMGLLVFFDGLANTLLLGRLFRSPADRCGVSRVKLAYLADTTGSAIACLAFISTWIAFQLSMIREGYEAWGREANAYALFFQSIPANFYCWFALLLAVLCATRGFNPGSMGEAESEARQAAGPEEKDHGEGDGKSAHWLSAILPILVLAFSLPFITYWIGAPSLLPFGFEKFAEAYGAAESEVPRIMVASSLLATLAAALACLWNSRGGKTQRPQIFRTFVGGARQLAGPIIILLTAWMLAAAIQQLETANFISDLLDGRIPAEFLPFVIFITGAIIAFTTGTSWGTMGVLMPLAIPVVFSMGMSHTGAEEEQLIVAAIAAVFSGAVFGDHCSPFSDTTILASIASGVEPMDHVRTQLPFAALAAAVAGLAGFLPLGFGFSPWLCLLLGSALLYLLSFKTPLKSTSIHPNHENTH